MKIKQVIDEVAEHGGWKIDKVGQIRRHVPLLECGQCVISALDDAPVNDYEGVAEWHGISRTDLDILAKAADLRLADMNARRDWRIRLVRLYMLRRFGLTE